MGRFLGLSLLLVVAACRTIEPGTGALTLTPETSRYLEQYLITSRYPLGFAVTDDGATSMSVGCSGRDCPAGWQDKLVRDCESVSGGRPCYLLAKRLELVWQGPVTRDGDLDTNDLEASSVRYAEAGALQLGAERAAGAIVFLPRRPGRADNDNATLPPYLAALNGLGWDILRGNIAPTLYPLREEFQRPVVASLADRIDRLRSAGYEKIIVAGHADAAATLFAIAGNEKSAPDGVIAVAPSWFGARSRAFSINYSLYKDAVGRLRAGLPIVLAFFRDDETEPRDRLKVTDQILAEAGVRNFIIHKPDGIAGSNGAWDTTFADRFAGCIHSFFVQSADSRDGGCETARPSLDDHRWMFEEADLEGSQAVRLNAASLIALLPGSRLNGVSPAGDAVLYEFDANIVTITGLYGRGPQSFPYRIDGEAFCIGERTCNRIYRWDAGLVIVVSAKTGEIDMRIQLSPDQAALLNAAES